MDNSAYAIGIMSNLNEKIRAFINEELNKAGLKGLISTHGSVLSILFRAEKPMLMKDLSEKMGKRKSSLTSLVAKLVEQGYVKKCECTSDCRATYVVLTEKGETLRPIFHQISEELIEKTYEGFSEEEREEFTRLLSKVSSNF